MNKILKNLLFYIENGVLRFKRKKDIIFGIYNDIMFSYAEDILKILALRQDIRCWITIPPNLSMEGDCLYKLKKRIKNKGYRILPYVIAEKINWDIVFLPDKNIYFRQGCKKIFSGHGLLVSVLTNGEEYIYSKQTLIDFDVIIEASYYVKDKVAKIMPEFKDKIFVAGSSKVDYILQLKDILNRRNFLKNIGLCPEKETIMFISHWGEESLLQKEWHNIKQFIPKMTYKYNVIFSTHRKNLSPKLCNGKDWGKEIIQFNKYDSFFFYASNEDPFKFLTVSDILITDHTSLGLYYLFLDRPLLFLDILDDDKFSRYSLMPEVKKQLYRIKDLSCLIDDIEKARTSFNKGQYAVIIDKLCSHIGEYNSRIQTLLAKLMEQV